MGSSPKSSDYAPSKMDRMNAAVAMREKEFFRQHYQPLLRKMRDIATSEDLSSTARGRANADTMQALTSALTYADTQSPDRSAGMAQATTGQLAAATTAAKTATNRQKLGVLGTARGQMADTQSAMSDVARLGTSAALQRARNKEMERAAKAEAIGQVAGAALSQGLENKRSGGSFFSPGATNEAGQAVNKQGQTKAEYEAATPATPWKSQASGGVYSSPAYTRPFTPEPWKQGTQSFGSRFKNLFATR